MTHPFDAETDIIVLGSGCAGLAAALYASVQGARVIILEKSSLVGGTSAMSGAGTWVPCNHHMVKAGLSDSHADAMAYIRSMASPGWAAEEEVLWQTFVANAADMLRFVEEHSPVRFKMMPQPDLYAEKPGGKDQGRTLSTELLSLNILGPWKHRMRKSIRPQIFTYEEMILGPVLRSPVKAVAKMWPKLLYRIATRRIALGGALMAGLFKGCLDHGCEIITEARAEELILDKDGDARGRIVGVEATVNGQRRRFHARKGVLIATGGFEWAPDLLGKFFPADHVMLGSPRTNTGDGHRMAMKVGAKMAHMDQATIYPVATTTYEGKPHAFPVGLLDFAHCILVNRDGKRFVNEGDRNNLSHTLSIHGHDHFPAWRIFDSQFTEKNRFAFKLSKGGELIKANTIAELAGKAGISGAALEETIERFNRFALAGKDVDFGRGETSTEHFYLRLKADSKGNAALGTIEKPPFYASRFLLGILGTKGGPRTNERGQVLREDGSVIAGLYCAGTAMANFIGTRNLANGSTLGPFMTWGYLCGKNLVLENQ